MAIKKMFERLDKKMTERHPKLRQWLWFVALWIFGFTAVSALAYFIKGIFWIGGAKI